MPIATKNGQIIVKEGKVAENCDCCGGWVCLECAPCTIPDAIRVTVSSTTAPIYHNCVCGWFDPGNAGATPTVAFAYYIKPPSGTFVLNKTSGNAVQATYQAGNLGEDVLIQASLSYGVSPEISYGNVAVRLDNLVRCRSVDGGTAATQEEMAAADWGSQCSLGTGGSARWFPSDEWIESNGYSENVSLGLRQVFMSECEYRGRTIVVIDQNCKNGVEARTIARSAGSTFASSGSSAAGCVPPVTMSINCPVALLGTAGGRSGQARVTNVRSVYDGFLFDGVVPLWLISTSLPSAPWPPPPGHLPNEIYSTPTVQHSLQVTIDSIDMLYGSSATPLFMDRGKPACTF